ncbi:MAG: hypothetical protein ACR2G5_01225 [Pyrinomonadaceae bacterium]
MKRPAKGRAKRGAKRDLFAELSEGLEGLAETRRGKRTARIHAVEYKRAPTSTPQKMIRDQKT